MKYIERFKASYEYKKQIGRQSLDEKVRWRLDYDESKGIHINFENLDDILAIYFDTWILQKNEKIIMFNDDGSGVYGGGWN